MHFVKLMGRIFSSVLLQFALLALVVSSSLAFVVLSSQNIKDAFHESGIYSNLIDTVIDQFDQSSVDDTEVALDETSEEEVSLPISEPGVREAIEKSLPPETTQQQTEGVIDDVFAWLEAPAGSELTFKLDLTMVKTDLIKNLSDYTVARTMSLPECSTEQLVLENPQQDILNATCRPPGFDSEIARQRIADELASAEFLEDPVITQDNITEDNGESFVPSERIPAAYKQIKSSVYVSALILSVVITMYIAIRLPLVKALKSLGKSLFVTGLASSVFLAIVKFTLTSRFEQQDAGGFDALMLNVARELAVKLVNFTLISMVIITAIGLILLVFDHLKLMKSGVRGLKGGRESSEAKNSSQEAGL